MKKHSRYVVVILTALILLFSFSAIIGIDRYVGSSKIVLTKGIKSLNYNKDIIGGVETSFKSKEKIDSELYEEISSTLKRRLATKGVNEELINVYYSNYMILLNFNLENNLLNMSPEIMKSIATNPKVEFRVGEQPDGELILELSDIAYAYWEHVDNEDINTSNIIQITLHDVYKDDETSAVYRLSEVSKKLLNGNVPITIWIDDEAVLPIWVDEPIEGASLSLVDENMDEKTAKEIAVKLGGGVLEVDLTFQNYGYNSYNSHIDSASFLLKAILITLLISSVFLIFTYRLTGIISSLLMLLVFASEIVLFSGFLPDRDGYPLSLVGMIGILVVIFISLITHIFLNHRIREELNSNRSLDDAINSAFKYTNSLRQKINIIVILIGILIVGAFDTSKGIFSFIFTPIFLMTEPLPNTYLYSFGLALYFGALMNHLSIRFLKAPMIRSLTAFHSFKNKTLFGGKFDE